VQAKSATFARRAVRGANSERVANPLDVNLDDAASSSRRRPSSLSQGCIFQLSLEPIVPHRCIRLPTVSAGGRDALARSRSTIAIARSSMLVTGASTTTPQVLRVVASLLAEPRHSAFRTFIDTCIAEVIQVRSLQGRCQQAKRPKTPPSVTEGVSVQSLGY
jgi:hypothetical protein